MKNILVGVSASVAIIWVMLLIGNAFQHSANHRCSWTNCSNATVRGHLKSQCTIHKEKCTQEDYEFWCLGHNH